MKKKLVVYLAGLLTVLGLGFGQAQFSDVPAGHWAKEAAERIAACGFITGFPDGTFRGNANLTRYQAALIFQRLLNELQQGGECVGPRGGSLSGEDLAAIRNAVQELAGELAALGVRVSALEDNAASKEDIARLEAAIEELKAMKSGPAPSGIDEAALADLADRVEAASVAADTALAQAQVLAERLDAVESDQAALKTQVEANADSVRALNELSVLLNQDVLSLQDRVTALEKQLGDVDFGSFASREDLSAIQEFSTALRSDLVRLSDRVSALSTTVDDLNNRLTKVEETRPSLAGGILARYGYRYTTGPDFDVDRLFPGKGKGFANDDDAADLSGNSDTQLQADLTFSLKRTAATTTDFNFTEASAALRWLGPDGSLFPQDGAENNLSLQSFSVKGNIDGQDLSISYARALSYKFNDYFFKDDGTDRGVTVNFDASKALLSPKITVVLGSSAAGGSGLDDFFGIRTAVNLLGLNASLNYAERDVLTGASYSGFGTDFNGKLFGLLDIDGGYFLSKSNANTSIDFATDPQVFYLTGGLSLGPLDLRGNYRALDSRFDAAGSNAGLLKNNDGQPFAKDNRGFGVLGSVKLGFLSLNGYYDNHTEFWLANPQTAFGVGASANLFAGFSLTGYLNSTSDSSGPVRKGNNPYDTSDPNKIPDALKTPATFGSNYGVRLAHDGSASNALLSGLNLFGEYRQSQGLDTNFGGSNGSRTDIALGASYDLKLGFLSITPDVRYHIYEKATTPGTEDSYSTLKYGVRFSTQTLNLGFIKPSLSGNFASRTTDFAASNDASETRYGVGLSFDDFLLPGATFSAKAAQVQGTNVDITNNARTCGNSAFSVDTDCLYNNPGADFGPISPSASAYTLQGLFFSYTYADAGIWYGVFDYDLNSDGTVDSVGRGFRIFYSLKF